MSRTILGTLACLCVFTVAAPARAQIPVYDSGGFEPLRFAPGNLNGQDPLGPWQQSLPTGGTSTATVQTATVQGGLQAVQLNRAANSNGYWGVTKPVVAPQSVSISWDMNVTPSVGPQTFGPLFGVDSYNSPAGGNANRLGLAGVDATTGEILYLDPTQGLQVTTIGSPTVTFNAWHNFRMQLNFNGSGGGNYSVFVDSILRQTAGFINSTTSFNFNDAPIAGLAAAGGAADLAATGTAFFDNYSITAVPEPSSIALAGVGLAGLIYRRRQRLARR
jgi:hypothetical protein